ncbi:MAG TPA: YfhO family protein [Patescibacteria group bacterium]|nr:YfhO family protein [Patescibacteria group bacterium]
MKKIFESFKQNLPQLSTIFFVVFFVLFPLLFGGYMFYDQEQIGFYYPQSFFHDAQVARGNLPQWNNAYFGGISVGLDQFVSSYYPVNVLLFKFFSFFTAHHLSIFISILASCLLVYWFGKMNGFSKNAALVVSLSYLSALTFEWLDIGTTAGHAFLVLPVLCIALFKIDREEHKWLFTFVGAVGLAVGFLAGFIQIVFYACAVAGFYAIYLDWHRKAKGLRRFKCIFFLALIGIVGVILGGWQIWPSVFLVSESVRTATYAMQQADIPGPNELLTLFLPDYIRLPFLGGGAAGFYTGALSFFIILLSLFFWIRKGTERFFALAYLLILGLAFRLPVFSFLNDHIPPFSHFGGQFRWMVMGAFPLAFLAGFGYQKLVDTSVSQSLSEKQKNRFLKYSGIALLTLIAGVVFFNIGVWYVLKRSDLQEKLLSLYLERRTLQFTIEHYLQVLRVALEEFQNIFSLLNYKMVVPLLLLVFAYLLLWFYLRKKFRVTLFEKLGLVLIVCNLLFVYSAQFGAALLPQRILDINNPPPLAQKVKEHNDPNSYRIAGFLISDSLFWKASSKRIFTPEENTKIYLDLLVNNTNVFYSIQRLDGMEPYATLRHNQILSTVIFPPGLNIFDPKSPAITADELNKLMNTSVFRQAVNIEEKVKDFILKLPLLSAYNVKFIYSLIPLQHPSLKHIPLSNVSVVGIPLYLYENMDYLPRVYFAKNSEFFTGNPNELILKMIENTDFKNKTFIECATCEKMNDNTLGNVEIVSYENGFVKLKTYSEHGGYLVFGESFNPGWKAQVDGQHTPIYNANYIFQAIFVPKGEHQVEFKFSNKNLWNLKKLFTKK